MNREQKILLERRKAMLLMADKMMSVQPIYSITEAVALINEIEREMRANGKQTRN